MLVDPCLDIKSVKPPCPVFGECGGCQYQDISYPDELKLKEDYLKQLFRSRLSVEPEVFRPIVASPQIYRYRNKLDLRFQRTRHHGILMGFSSDKKMVPVESCPIALGAISDFLPRLKEQVIPKFTEKYRMANLVVKMGDDDRICWGGIGKRSLRQAKEDYLWVDIDGKRIFYALDTFFQANRSILPEIIGHVRSRIDIVRPDVFFDFYAGVGLFGLFAADLVPKTVLIEENRSSIEAAEYNVAYNRTGNIDIIPGKVEEVFAQTLEAYEGKKAAMIDPPRAGLRQMASVLAFCRGLDSLYYLSCNAETLVEDLAVLLKGGWQIREVSPFDFFPRTKHLETFVALERNPE